MILKVNNTEHFNLSMTLDIDYNLEQINICVKLWNKNTHKTQARFFPASAFSDALRYFKESETFFFPQQ